MDRELEQQKETIRTTMLMQECNFQQQVKELHRLYNVQRTLMEELKQKTCRPTSNNQSCLGNDLKLFVQPQKDEATSSRNSEASCTSNTAVTCKSSSVARYFDLQRHNTQQKNCCTSPVEFGNLSIGNSGGEESEEVDLTLSIGFGGNRCRKQ